MSGLPEYVDGMKWELAYWEWCAKYGRRKRVWCLGFDSWRIGLYGDEYNRRTLVLGPVVFALWGCRCVDCRAEEKALTDAIERVAE